jgi:hypothetical protein
MSWKCLQANSHQLIQNGPEESKQEEEVLLLIDGDNFICGAEQEGKENLGKENELKRELYLDVERLETFVNFLQR